MAVVRASFREWYQQQLKYGVAVADTVTSASATPQTTLKLQHDLWFVYLQLPPHTMPATTIKQQQLQHQRAPVIMAWHMRFCVCHAIIIPRACCCCCCLIVAPSTGMVFAWWKTATCFCLYTSKCSGQQHPPCCAVVPLFYTQHVPAYYALCPLHTAHTARKSKTRKYKACVRGAVWERERRYCDSLAPNLVPMMIGLM